MRRVWIGVLLGLCCFQACVTEAPSEASNYDLSPVLEGAQATGKVRGIVVDEMGFAITASVTVGATTVMSDATGRFEVTVPVGRAFVLVQAPERVPLTRTVGITSQPPFLRLALAARAPKQIVPGGKASALVSGGASLQFDAGAYAKDIGVSATWLGPSDLAFMSGRPIFSTNGMQERIVGQIHVEADAQPSSPVVLNAPAVPDLPDGAELVLYSLETGELGPSVPNQGTNEKPRFLVSHFSDYVMAVQLPDVNFGYAKTWVLQVTSGLVTDGSGREYHSGERVAPGTILRGNFTIWAPSSAQIDNGGAAMQVDTADDGSTSATCIELCRANVEVKPELTQGTLQTGRPRLLIRTHANSAVGVRGTVFRVEEKSCSEASKTDLVFAEVSEGTVDLDVTGYSTKVSAGKQARVCEGCANPKSTTCDCDPIACDRVAGKCLKCADGVGHGTLLPDSPFCVPADATCCEGQGKSFAGLCSETTNGRALCQCRGERTAECATLNSRCVEEPAARGKRVLDCGRERERPLQCFHSEVDPGGPPSQWRCDGLSDYLTDRNNCGSCGHVCAGKYDVCYEGKCVDCNKGCGNGKVWCQNLGKCCTFPATGFSTTCIGGPDAVAPGCPPYGYNVAQGGTPGTCQ